MSFGKILFTILAATLVIGGGYVLTLFSPKPIDPDSMSFTYATDKENQAYLLKSEQLEKEFEQKFIKLGATEDVVGILRQAVRLQEIYIDRAITRDRAPAERLMKLRTRLQNIEAKPLAEIVADLEKKANEAAAKDDIAVAEKLYSDAYSMQTKINVDYNLSRYKNVQKAMTFDSQAKTMKARPLYLRSVEAENAAKKAIEEGKWDLAVASYEKSIDYLSKLNSDFPTSIYTDFARLQSLDIELASLRSSQMYTKLEGLLKKADEAKSKKEYMLASEIYGDAIEIQKQINKVYPNSRHASEEALSKLQKEKTDAYSWDYANAINQQEKKLYDIVKTSTVTAIAEVSSNLLRKAEQFKNDYPRSTQINPDIILKVRYINFMAREIPQIQKMVNDNLIDIGGGTKMLATEVTQKLYKAVMKENPSRYSESDLNPVDSVSYDDVERFCTRLSWVMSADVSLPTQEEFIKATGSLRYADLNEISWNNRNSGSRTHSVATKKKNDKGFFDLLGNVEEFTKKNPEVDGILVVGGSAQSSTDSILDYAKRIVDEKTRSRVLGFRITVK